ncbi:hypothetical protein BABINDRAFT_160335 [Babjeviella inositovora NRRL Y-12698]|uniref:Uncharacterized protein n=1 Tax=Babjeviella inositovora NRRL Y-12698 TaxID=984486 RepID=A0A1E3QYJ8_9ASCO|nr:uncharacterized protein BABINDRAFT_160335 [Babjeviella inositovora NRRL Y-12698]ODQ82157.1 hypothetical protein BABINDRAFT_160335 [Babjeviella inositovora NRRL Y-12698]
MRDTKLCHKANPHGLWLTPEGKRAAYLQRGVPCNTLPLNDTPTGRRVQNCRLNNKCRANECNFRVGFVV